MTTHNWQDAATQCPACGSKDFTRCRCMKADATCKKCGFSWHRCVKHQRWVLGTSDHSKPTTDCSCPIKQDEMLTCPEHLYEEPYPYRVVEDFQRVVVVDLRHQECPKDFNTVWLTGAEPYVVAEWQGRYLGEQVNGTTQFRHRVQSGQREQAEALCRLLNGYEKQLQERK